MLRSHYLHRVLQSFIKPQVLLETTGSLSFFKLFFCCRVTQRDMPRNKLFQLYPSLLGIPFPFVFFLFCFNTCCVLEYS